MALTGNSCSTKQSISPTFGGKSSTRWVRAGLHLTAGCAKCSMIRDIFYTRSQIFHLRVVVFSSYKKSIRICICWCTKDCFLVTSLSDSASKSAGQPQWVVVNQRALQAQGYPWVVKVQVPFPTQHWADGWGEAAQKTIKEWEQRSQGKQYIRVDFVP